MAVRYSQLLGLQQQQPQHAQNGGVYLASRRMRPPTTPLASALGQPRQPRLGQIGYSATQPASPRTTHEMAQQELRERGVLPATPLASALGQPRQPRLGQIGYGTTPGFRPGGLASQLGQQPTQRPMNPQSYAARLGIVNELAPAPANPISYDITAPLSGRSVQSTAQVTPEYNQVMGTRSALMAGTQPRQLLTQGGPTAGPLSISRPTQGYGLSDQQAAARQDTPEELVANSPYLQKAVPPGLLQQPTTPLASQLGQQPPARPMTPIASQLGQGQTMYSVGGPGMAPTGGAPTGIREVSNSTQQPQRAFQPNAGRVGGSYAAVNPSINPITGQPSEAATIYGGLTRARAGELGVRGEDRSEMHARQNANRQRQENISLARRLGQTDFRPDDPVQPGMEMSDYQAALGVQRNYSQMLAAQDAAARRGPSGPYSSRLGTGPGAPQPNRPAASGPDPQIAARTMRQGFVNNLYDPRRGEAMPTAEQAAEVLGFMENYVNNGATSQAGGSASLSLVERNAIREFSTDQEVFDWAASQNPPITSNAKLQAMLNQVRHQELNRNRTYHPPSQWAGAAGANNQPQQPSSPAVRVPGLGTIPAGAMFGNH